VTRTVLSSEAGMIGSGGSGSPAGFDTLLRTARELGRDQDPFVRVELADLWMREQLMRYLGMRFQAFLLGGRGTPPDPSVLKNFLTASNERMNDLAMQVLGPAGMVDGPGAVDRGLWASSLLWQFASRIGGGTNEVHRNMLAERALGLPREDSPDKDLPWSSTRRA
jgi:alkylation response protein AidB-like acyl-CoA dehydrogenase